ncbi:23S rRNA (adenine(2503)-C(2))-methyltransferase RlmN [Raoultibacter phocaeensis]|uniref:23S rRNA (adenine(2503)-C(2))-methyltransferase RlmN n=1 Tax=Raoultibacter phocaeensis TaxID=2479841 RepID=UPI00111BB159|nr:23S rRNA (adenine(2503)-C(2))-methyltransferase RlmN [Raoultibacter phocaeensis]
MERDIKSLDLDELAELVQSLGQPAFRTKQLFQWLYGHHVRSWDEMTNLPASLRSELASSYPLRTGSVVNRQVSKDETRKYVIEFHDGACVETVAMPTFSSDAPDRLSICFSTQAGCAMGCSFCATGKEGFTRNLTIGEMIDQIVIAQQDLGMRASSLVAMGQGEPFLNYDNTIAALHIANSPQSLNIGARHITISTCGILKGIQSLSHEPEQFTLAVSLHSAEQQVRDRLMPSMASVPLERLKEALNAYREKTNRRVTFEYIMIHDVNDTKQALEHLVSFCSGMLCHVNLLPINEIVGSPYHPSSSRTMKHWVETLSRNGIETTVRHSRGSDIAGACGQLKNSL